MSYRFQTAWKYEIYIGLKDRDSYNEIVDNRQFKAYWSAYCTENKIDYSVKLMQGGYTHNKGYTTETSMLITLIGAEFEAVLKAVELMKEFVNTDTVMVTREPIDTCFI